MEKLCKEDIIFFLGLIRRRLNFMKEVPFSHHLKDNSFSIKFDESCGNEKSKLQVEIKINKLEMGASDGK